MFNETSHWLYFDRDDRDLLLNYMMDATSGKSMVVGKYPFSSGCARLIVVVACGDPDFSATVRKAVIDRRATRHIDFVEVQYRPSHRLSRATYVNSEKGKDKLSNPDIDMGKGRSKRIKNEAVERKRGKFSTANDVDLEKGAGKARKIRQEEDEEWDDITLYSPTTIVAGDYPPKTWQKKAD